MAFSQKDCTTSPSTIHTSRVSIRHDLKSWIDLKSDSIVSWTNAAVMDASYANARNIPLRRMVKLSIHCRVVGYTFFESSSTLPIILLTFFFFSLLFTIVVRTRMLEYMHRRREWGVLKVGHVNYLCSAEICASAEECCSSRQNVFGGNTRGRWREAVWRNHREGQNGRPAFSKRSRQPLNQRWRATRQSWKLWWRRGLLRTCTYYPNE